MPIASNRLAVLAKRLIWLVLPADEEYGVADCLDREAERSVLSAREAQEVAERAAAAEYVHGLGVEFSGTLGKESSGCGLDGVL